MKLWAVRYKLKGTASPTQRTIPTAASDDEAVKFVAAYKGYLGLISVEKYTPPKGKKDETKEET